MSELTENWTAADLNIYINRIREDERDLVLAQVLDKRRLRQYLDTPDGKLILRDAINTVHSELMEIFKLVIDDPRKNIDKIVTSSDRYRAVINIMNRWMVLLKKGEEHEKKMAEKKK